MLFCVEFPTTSHKAVSLPAGANLSEQLTVIIHRFCLVVAQEFVELAWCRSNQEKKLYLRQTKQS